MNKYDIYTQLPLSDIIEDLISILEYYKSNLNDQDLLLHNSIEKLLEMRYLGIDIKVIKNEFENLINTYNRSD